MSDVAGAHQPERDWRDIVAMGVVAEDLSVAGLSRVAGVTAEAAKRGLREAAEAGVLVEGQVARAQAEQLTARLSVSQIAEVHASVALYLLCKGPEYFVTSLDHARAASELDQSDLVRRATGSGRLALATGDHGTAALLLQAAVDLDHEESSSERPRLLLDLARAEDGCGRVGAARDLLSEAVRLASAAGDHDLVVDAAVRSAFPPDWRAGDRRTSALLDLAEQLAGDGSRIAAILAARAMAEMRLPASADPGQQVAWVTRSGVAQPLAERAVSLTESSSTPDRLVTLAASRSTHRGPAWLDQRLDVSLEAVDLAQRLIDHDRLVDAGVMLAVDQLESGHRAGYDATLAAIRWAAETDGNPRLRWWAATVTVGASFVAANVNDTPAVDISWADPPVTTTTASTTTTTTVPGSTTTVANPPPTTSSPSAGYGPDETTALTTTPPGRTRWSSTTRSRPRESDRRRSSLRSDRPAAARSRAPRSRARVDWHPERPRS